MREPCPPFGGSQFEDFITPYELDEASIVPGEQIAPLEISEMPDGTAVFEGFPRAGGRGTGTRNYVAVIPTTSRTAALARKAARSIQVATGTLPESVDGVVAIEHTEAGGDSDIAPHNIEFVKRVLAGLAVHCNVGAAVVVSRGDEALTGEQLEAFMADNGYPMAHVPLKFVNVGGMGFTAAVEAVVAAGSPLVAEAAASSRTTCPAADICVALQCGGSDAFSGVSGNPLAGSVARELVRRGGSAILAETDELIGAESHVLKIVRNASIARRFVDFVALFRERLGWHGQTAEANPSVGNNYRGLYNIALKSLGAGMKKPVDVRLDDVLDYGERKTCNGYLFMNSPGNDIESIAGQVASGCNLIFFTTGNGSITNFPLVPTCKIVTNSGRFAKLAKDMDINAGEYLDGTSMADLTLKVLRLAVAVSSGQRTKGEKAGHAQVQIWRSWPQTTLAGLEAAQAADAPSGTALALRAEAAAAGGALPTADLFSNPGGPAGERIGLVLPTSLCSGQIARLVADKLNEGLATHVAAGTAPPVTRFVALPHTEGCGAEGPMAEYFASMAGHLLHPSVWRGLLLEHGCEKMHNDEMRAAVRAAGRSPEEFGWFSVQLDGGIDAVHDRIQRWFDAQAEAEAEVETEAKAEASAGSATALTRSAQPLSSVVVGVATHGAVPLPAATLLCGAIRAIVGAGGSVVVPESSTLLETAAFQDMADSAGSALQPTIAFGQRVSAGQSAPTGHAVSARPPDPTTGAAASAAGAAESKEADPVGGVAAEAVSPGLHIMACPTSDWSETATGIVSTGAQVVIAHTRGSSTTGHPIVPVLMLGSSRAESADADAIVGEDDSVRDSSSLLELAAAVLSARKATIATSTGNVGWQITRGKFCVSV